MKIQNLVVEEALASLHSSANGLTAEEAQRRIFEYGPNEVEEIRDEPMLLRFLKGFTHFFAIILWIAAALSFFAEWREPGQGMATLGFAIIAVIAINGVFSFWQEYRAEQAVVALKKLLPQRVKVLRVGGAAEENISNLVPGDIILLAEGDNATATFGGAAPVCSGFRGDHFRACRRGPKDADRVCAEAQGTHRRCDRRRGKRRACFEKSRHRHLDGYQRD
jgi:sodium/potassium-transporting ATPase subunit alpha